MSKTYGSRVLDGAEAGAILKQRYDRDTDEPLLDINNEIDAHFIPQMQEQMESYPIRFPELGKATDTRPIIGSDKPKIVSPEEVDFRLAPDSEAVDFGAIYFIPFSLYGTVGEWHFTENRAKPATVIDYHWYMSEAHFYRMLYEQVPTFDLQLNNATLEDYQDAPHETWARGAMTFDGSRFGMYPDSELRKEPRRTSPNSTNGRRTARGSTTSPANPSTAPGATPAHWNTGATDQPVYLGRLAYSGGEHGGA